MGRVIDAIVYDCDEVVCPTGAKEFPVAIAEKYGLRQRVVDRVYKESAEKDRYKRGKMLGSQFWPWLIRELNIPATPQDLFRIMRSCYTIDEELLRWADARREEGIINAMCTNMFAERHELLERQFSLSDHFDLIVPSYESHSVKPERQMFRYLASQLRIPPENALFVDNDSDAVRVAKDLGFHAVVYEGLASLDYAYQALE